MFQDFSRMMEPIQRVNVDFAAEMLRELDEAARALNISRQAVIKTLVRDGLDRRYFAKARGRKARQSGN
jgi:metal-responsive CopG/Arc/MetJ family transcriptional regulator